MKFIIMAFQRGQFFVTDFDIPNKSILDVDDELYSWAKEKMRTAIYEAHKRELEKEVRNERDKDYERNLEEIINETT